MVVPDASKDLRFVRNSLTTGPVNLRFYAGSPIICQGMKIGAVCVIDSVPHDDFDEKKQTILSDVAAILSSLMENRRLQVLEQEGELAKLIVGVNHHLKVPLRHLENLSSQLDQTRPALLSLPIRNGVMELLGSVTLQLREEVQNFHQQVEIGLLVAAAYDNAKRRVRQSRAALSMERLVPNVEYRNGSALIDVLQRWPNLLAASEQKRTIEWELCKILHHGDVMVEHVDSLAIVLAASIILGGRGCERMKVNCSIEAAGGYYLPPLPVRSKDDDNEDKEKTNAKSARLMVNLTMSRDKMSVKASGDKASSNTFSNPGFGFELNTKQTMERKDDDNDLDDEEVIEQCNSMICQTILQVEHGDYRQQKRVVMNMEVLMINCWIPCVYKLAPNLGEEDEPKDHMMKLGEKTPSAAEFTGMAAIQEGEEDEEREEEDGRRSKIAPAVPAAPTDDALTVSVVEVSVSKQANKSRAEDFEVTMATVPSHSFYQSTVRAFGRHRKGSRGSDSYNTKFSIDDPTLLRRGQKKSWGDSVTRRLSHYATFCSFVGRYFAIGALCGRTQVFPAEK
eukprot:scaffold607_cov160-Ochromonas_danica.AAC.22